MRRIPDPTGRFAERLFYDNCELDDIAERLITDFIINRHGKLLIPIPTDDLTILIERDATNLDSYADLKPEGEGVQGVTNFIPGKKPKVRIEASLWKEHTGHRLRTTLTHEYGHVKLHTALYDAKGAQKALDLFPDCCMTQKCHDGTLLRAKQGIDWLEWQAGYMSGALLMPANHVNELIFQISRATGNEGVVVSGTRYADSLVNTVKDTYDVSKEAARIRLFQLGRIVLTHHQNLEISF